MHPIHLCIGAPRAGTTWLFREMSRHPALFVPLIKEVRFWNSRRSADQRDHAIKNGRRLLEASHDNVDQTRWLDDWSKIDKEDDITMETYRSLMAVNGRPSLDISPSYCFLQPKQIKNLRAGLPKGSKVLYLMRDPLQRLSSQVKLHCHLHGMYRGRPSEADMAQFLAIPDQRRRWDYATTLNMWKAEFGDDFITLSFEDVVNDPKALTYRLADLLQIDLGPKIAKREDTDFFHSDRNQNSQIWVTSLGMSEKKMMAQEMLPAIKNLAEQLPNLATPWLSKLNKVATHNITAPNPVDDIDLPTQKLMRMTESIGDNCEYGMWQRHRAYDPSSLFRWAITPIDNLLAFLDAPTPLYAQDDLSVHSPRMVHDQKSGFKFHSKLVEMNADGARQLLSDKEKFSEIYLGEYNKISHLQAKFFAQMKRQTGLYIIKDNKGLSEEKVRCVLAHLHRHNPTHHLLWVEAEGEPSFTDLGSGLLRGKLPKFAPYIDVQAYAEGGWTSLMTKLSRFEPLTKQVARMKR